MLIDGDDSGGVSGCGGLVVSRFHVRGDVQGIGTRGVGGGHVDGGDGGDFDSAWGRLRGEVEMC